MKTILIFAFSLALITNFLKEFLSINPKGHLNVDWKQMKDIFITVNPNPILKLK